METRRRRTRDRGLVAIALFKLVKAVLLIAVGLGALKLLHAGLAGGAQRLVTTLTSGVDRRITQRILSRLSGVSPGKLEALGLGAFVYAALFGVEGVGLWMGKRWAEYLTVIATGSFIPFEIYELVKQFTAVRLLALVLNVAMVVYLILRLRHPHSGE
jgi:uncharacterized membrane protein (DUF2068 family)